ncbi:cadherin EGF LAG seven-pass G-type receptor 2 [Patella vulgata]|uniref:cadherin EGF LAG seven-pass G-type receptor 2 n=1 Tax=Patella vulgata TaxID=6465 RepID=UPI0024A95EF1|nr:cadherin EGF LAG seven-pass G-type receptor 2 [Patella vulgata]
MTNQHVIVMLGVFFRLTDGGIYYYHNTSTSHYDVSQLGIDLNTTSSLRLEIKACYDQLLRLLDGPVTDSGSYFLEIVFSGKYVGIRDRCEGCQVTQVKYLKTFDCNNSKRFWISWNGTGHLMVGTDYLIDSGAILSYQSATTFSISVITLRSYYQPGYWTILKDDPPVVYYPSMDGSTVLVFNESLVPPTEILQTSVDDPENDTIVIRLDSRNINFQVVNFTMLLIQPLDYETEERHNVTMIFSDGLNEVNVTVIVDVTDVVDEPPAIAIGSDLVIQEELPTTTVIVGLFNVSDADRNDTLTYILTGQDASYLSIDSISGTLTLAKTVDRDGAGGKDQLGPLLLRVIDSVGLMDEKNFTLTVLDINDNSPTCDPDILNITVFENGTKGIRLLTMNCSDPDDSMNTNLTYVIQDSGHLNNMVYFSDADLLIDSNLLDLETLKEDEFELTLFVRDTYNQSMTNTATAQVHIKVLGVNENAPVFNGSSGNVLADIHIWSSTEVETIIVTVLATDEDWGNDGIVLYNITNITSSDNNSASSNSSPFKINYFNGDISLSTEVNSVDKNTTWYSLEITAADSGIQSRSQMTSLMIYIHDVNQYKPMIDKDIYHLTIICNQTIGSFLTVVNNSNFEENVKSEFKLLQNENEGFLIIDATNGSIYLKSLPKSKQTFRTVAEVTVYNTHAPKQFSTALVISKFDSCLDRITSDPNSEDDSATISYSYSIDDFVDDLKEHGVQAVCGVETLILICIGITYVVKTKSCRKQEVHPLQDTNVQTSGNISKGTISDGTLASNKSISNTSTTTTRCSSIESLRLI